jgi:hypothetical protein
MNRPKILELTFLPNYMLKLRFNTNETKLYDAKACARGDWGAPLKNFAYFSTAKISEDKTYVEWPNGIDICPDALYEDSKAVPTTEVSVDPFFSASNIAAIDEAARQIERGRVVVKSIDELEALEA